MGDTAKQITSDTLEDGGKLQPVQGLPRSGLVITPPNMAEWIADGSKTVIVKTRPFDIDGRQFLLLSQCKALGVVKLGKREQIDDKRFAELESKHLISEKIRAAWCEAQPSWCKGPFYAWPVAGMEKFGEPLDTDIEVGPQVIVSDVEIVAKTSKLVEKIKDPAGYDPSKANDAQLRDDFRIALAWYASWKKDPEDFKYDLETIETLLRKILKELVRRGPKVIRFNPRGMSPSVRAFFQQVAADVKVPQPMFKALDLKSDTDPSDLTGKELDVAHKMLHEMFSKEAQSQQEVEGWSVEDIVNLHARIVDRMFKLGGGGHPPPPDNGLDELSSDFEKYAEKQPKWHLVSAEKLVKGRFATINHSGDKRGPLVKLDDVVPHFETFKARTPYIYLVGGLANHGETKGDIDILVNEKEEEVPEWLRDVIHFRLGRALPGPLAKRLQIHYDRDRGPFTNHVELYDLHLERVNVESEIKEMRDESDEPFNLLRSIDELGVFVQQKKADASANA